MKSAPFTISVFICLLVFSGPLQAVEDLPATETEAFQGFRPSTKTPRFDYPLGTLVSTPLACANQTLHPLTSHQGTKLYHEHLVGGFDPFKIDGDSSACAISGPKTVRFPRGACLRADQLFKITISDLYKDECGNIYRGVWSVVYFQREENMATMFSKGKTMYMKDRSDFQGDYEVGPTYSVDAREFLMLIKPLPSDLAKIQATK